ncbi:MAG: carboxypeptidase-like regulatory domain-containing protein [Nitrospirota bacterium]|nr:carboxypeptidase-like regulatory domain-containing protein [Nitrospirota bacterium]
MRQILIPAFVLLSSLCVGVSFADDPVPRIGESGESLELEFQVNGQRSKGSLPLYRAEAVRYFSAGVGIEERSAEYPPFSLKLVFTAGGKPFLAGVAVTIQPAKGGPAINIPQEHVNGPWLFVDLPAGTYRVTAIHAARTQGLKGIKLEAGKTKTVHLRWSEDRVSTAPSRVAVGQ